MEKTLAIYQINGNKTINLLKCEFSFSYKKVTRQTVANDK
ncbi:hypothetical protein SAMN04487896_4795 [Paenibacillus sp. ov031]|nr:hypothetical protein SAMN04487896_4795 [Paenibacillus sp. ov031]